MHGRPLVYVVCAIGHMDVLKIVNIYQINAFVSVSVSVHFQCRYDINLLVSSRI